MACRDRKRQRARIATSDDNRAAGEERKRCVHEAACRAVWTLKHKTSQLCALLSSMPYAPSEALPIGDPLPGGLPRFKPGGYFVQFVMQRTALSAFLIARQHYIGDLHGGRLA